MPYKAVIQDANALPEFQGRAFFVLDRVGAVIAHSATSTMLWKTRWTGDEEAIDTILETVERTLVDLLTEYDLPLRVTNCTIELYLPETDEWVEWLSIRDCVQAWYDDIGADLIRDLIRETIEDEDKDFTDDELQELLDEMLNGIDDNIYAGCLQATKYLFDTIQAFCDLIDAAVELIDAVTEMSGIIGRVARRIIPQGRIFDIALELVEFGTSIIVAQLTEANQLDYACRLFCLIKANGDTINSDILREWIKAIRDNIDFSNGAASAGVLLTCTSDLFGADDTKILDNYSLIDPRQLLTYYAIGLKKEDDRWEILCNDCVVPVWEKVFDFTGSDEGWLTRISGQSVHVPSQGWGSSGALFSNSWKEAGCKTTVNLFASVLEEVTVNYYSANPKNTGGTWTWRLTVEGDNYELPSGTGEMSHTINTSISGEIDLTAFMHFTKTLATNSCFIRSIVLRGSGDDPFI